MLPEKTATDLWDHLRRTDLGTVGKPCRRIGKNGSVF